MEFTCNISYCPWYFDYICFEQLAITKNYSYESSLLPAIH